MLNILALIYCVTLAFRYIKAYYVRTGEIVFVYGQLPEIRLIPLSRGVTRNVSSDILRIDLAGDRLRGDYGVLAGVSEVCGDRTGQI